MDSTRHFLIGVVVSAAALVPLSASTPTLHLATLFGYGVALSVLVDLDHFFIARVLVGDWRHLRRVLANPLGLFGDQAWVFEDVRRFEDERLLSHHAIGGVLVTGTWLAISPAIGAFTAVVLYAHVLADLVHDVRQPSARS